MNRILQYLMVAAWSAVLLNPLSTSHAQGTAFTYQGRLNAASGPATGVYDLKFTLFTTNASSLVVQAGPVTNFATVVTGGLFVASVDFGPGTFLGSSNWLDLAVRTNGAAAFTELTPRQQIQPAPYAQYAATAATAGSVGAGNLIGTVPLAQLPAVLLTNNASGITLSGNLFGNFGGTFFGGGGGLTGLSPANLAAGTAGINITGNAATATTAAALTGPVADPQLSANIARLNGTNAFTGTNTFAGVTVATNGNNQLAGAFTGNGGGLTNLNLNFSQASGTLPLAQLPPAVVTNNETGVTLSGAFAGNGGGLTNLNPASLAAGTANINISGNAATATLASTVASGAIGSAQLAGGAAAANLAASGQGSVSSGGLVLSAVDNTALLAAGYVKIGTTTLNDSWQQKSVGTYLSARYQAAAVWDGTEMLVWGGVNSASVDNDGARYNPAANVWTLIPTNGAPLARYQHTAVWDGSAMIVWGGEGAAGTYLNDGGCYNPVANTWTPVTTTGAPSARYLHTAVWDGTEMIIWGGANTGSLGDGARYNPVSNLWTTLPSSGAPAARFFHTAIWDGVEMIVWGGLGTSYFNTGAKYNPASNLWTATSTAGAPAARELNSAVWDGSGMMVWGGSASGTLTNDGGRYNPVADTWTPLPTTGAPGGRCYHSAVWDGAGMLIWGGTTNLASPFASSVNDGARYVPATASWSPLATNNVPALRIYQTTLWDGGEMVVWGGINTSANALGDGGRYSPATGSWTPLSTTAPPAARGYHTAVWDGVEMIVWGGFNAVSGPLNDGQRYVAAANLWKPMSSLNAPAARCFHTAVWDGTEMIAWGGSTNNTGLVVNTGGRYNPVSDSWLPTATLAAPEGRRYHTAVWDGSGMIIWGGATNNGQSYVNDGARYVPGSDSWAALSSVGAPAPRAYHTAVWDGSGMIVWGGASNNSLTVTYSDGGRYSPVSGNWTSLPASPLSARYFHTAVWDGAGMIIWGGTTNYSSGLGDGARYNPSAGTWTTLPTNNAPFARFQHTAVWDGSGMIVWGGSYANASVTGSEGGRYTPANNAWTATSMLAPPSLRAGHTAVWDGNEMLLFGGFGTAYLGDLWSYTPPKTMILYQKL